MEAYDPSYAPRGFGLKNTGAICYLNSFLQVLAGCTAFTRAALRDQAYMRRTRTGAALLEYVKAYADEGGARPQPSADIACLSALVLAALQADLAVRRPGVRFGLGQESASEALVHLLDMVDPVDLPAGVGGADAIQASVAGSPVARLFQHRFRCELHCHSCRRAVSTMTDSSVILHLTHYTPLLGPVATAADFSTAVRVQVTPTEDFACEACAERQRASGVAGGGARPPAVRVHKLAMIPEILFCAFNVYGAHGAGPKAPNYFPEQLEIPAAGGGVFLFRVVGQIEHAGTLAGGHYWARVRRAEGVAIANDESVVACPGGFAPTHSTYIVAYHYYAAGPAPGGLSTAGPSPNGPTPGEPAPGEPAPGESAPGGPAPSWPTQKKIWLDGGTPDDDSGSLR